MTDTATARTVYESTSLDEISVERVMHEGFIGCPLETPLRTVAKLMAERRVHCVVGFGDVAADDTCLCGVVADVDVVVALAAGKDLATAGQIASTEVVTIEPHASVRHAAELMRDHEVTHLLVIDGVSDRPIGIVSTLDVMAIAAGIAPVTLELGVDS